MSEQKNNPLHGKTLKTILEYLIDYYGWEQLSMHVDINCFKSNPTLKSSLNFLRNKNHEWARRKVEELYVKVIQYEEED